jgi:hypothetical protein
MPGPAWILRIEIAIRAFSSAGAAGDAVSMFRKLGVSSRSEAIEMADEIGLLGH